MNQTATAARKQNILERKEKRQRGQLSNTSCTMTHDATNGYAEISEDGCQLFAKCLPQEASEADIKKHFSPFGVVTYVNLEMNLMTGGPFIPFHCLRLCGHPQ